MLGADALVVCAILAAPLELDNELLLDAAVELKSGYKIAGSVLGVVGGVASAKVLDEDNGDAAGSCSTIHQAESSSKSLTRAVGFGVGAMVSMCL